MKKISALLLTSALTLGLLAGCGNDASSSGSGASGSGSGDGAFVPEGTVTWVCTSSAGGGSDIFSRQIQTILGPESGGGLGLVDATIVVDNRRRTVRIVNSNAYYAGQQTVHVTAVEDTYEAERADEDDEPEAVELMQCDVRYSFPSSAYWNGMDLTEAVTAEARHKTIGTDYMPNVSVVARLDAWFAEKENQDLTVIVTDSRSGERAYIAELQEDPFGQDTAHPRWEFLDLFHRIERENPDQEVELDMMPAEINQGASYRYLTTQVDGNDGWGDYNLYAPVLTDAEALEDDAGEDTPVGELLSSASDSEGSSKGKISLAFYSIVDLNPLYGGSADRHFYFPACFTSPYLSGQMAWTIRNFIANSSGLTLSLERLEELLWTGTYDINQKDAIKISSHDPNLYDARYIFEIRNKRYVCREMEFTLDANGRKGAWTGTFYPIRISDTEADARWILTDGRWRDGGVWLDNGRWLDDPT